MVDEIDGKHGVQSIEIGLGLLRVMMKGHHSMMLKDIAAAAGMPASKAHRYLVSLIRAGLVEQNAGNGRYALGPFALNLGLVALNRLDRLQLGLQAIAELRDNINETIALAVWGERGPVVVRWERPRLPITVNVVTGVQLPLITSASGRVFAAWLPKTMINPLIAHELKTLQLPETLRSRPAVDGMLEQVRRNGAATLGHEYYQAGVQALAAPVFNFKNEITMALAAVGVQGASDFALTQPKAMVLMAAAHALSLRLGYGK